MGINQDGNENDSYSHGNGFLDSHQRLRKIVVEYSNKWLMQYTYYNIRRHYFTGCTHLSRIGLCIPRFSKL